MHKHFLLGENKQWFPEEEFIAHLAEPRCYIRFDVSLGMFAEYEEFFNGIAGIQWIDGKPSDSDIETTLINAWSFLTIEERILEQFHHEL